MKTSRLILVTLLLFVGPLSAAEWILTFAAIEDQVIETPDGKGPPRQESRSYTQKVALGADYLVVQDDRRKTVYDFAARRMVMLDLAANSCDDRSLYHLPSFLEYELTNRNGIGFAMRAAKIERLGVTFTRFDNETALRVESRRAPPDSPVPVIETVKLADALEFRHQGALVARFTPAATPLPAGWRHRFVNYLAYSCNIHPQIRRAVAGTDFVPRELTFTWRTAGNVTTTTLRLLSSAATGTDSSRLPAGAKPALHPDDPFYAVLAASEAAARSPERPGRAAAVKFADDAMAAKRPLDAVMALLEFDLQSGESLTDDLRRHRDSFIRDADCRAFIAGMRSPDKAAAEKCLAANAAIDRRGLAKAHMLDLQRANLLEAAGRPQEAIEPYFKVLRANPYHAGALHDLGLNYARGFEPAKAWLCWDAARRLYPAHPMLRDIARIEQELLANEPDFF